MGGGRAAVLTLGTLADSTLVLSLPNRAARLSSNRRIEFHAGLCGQQPLANSGVVKVTDGNRQGVRRVVWFGNSAQLKQHPHHLLDLLLVGVAVTGDRLLYQTRGVLANLESRALSHQERDA